MYGAILLAAGASTRMGSPKALVKVGTEPAIARACRQLASLGVHEIAVVVGAHAEAIRPAAPAPARVVVNAEWQRGRTGSVKVGLRALPDASAFLVWPIDHPCVSDAALEALVAQVGGIRVPTFQGRRGHPTAFAGPLRNEVLRLEDDQPLHDVLHARPGRVVEVPVDDPGVLLNVDTPDDLKKLETFLRGSRHARPLA
ncbi:MAG: nucleotidyltransferase family protein [Euryarchaeota archaeon]|nr:nucleotidyltransferase family protein [Euryarchaeota archaeon]